MVAFATDVGGSAPLGTATASFEVSGGGGSAVSTVAVMRVTPDPDPSPLGFGVSAFDTRLTADAAGTPLSDAGAHPFAYDTSIEFNAGMNANALKTYFFPPNDAVQSVWPVEPEKDVTVDLPPGLVGSQTAAAQCTYEELVGVGAAASEPLCPPSSQVGTVSVRANNTAGLGESVFGPVPVYNLVPAPNVPASFGFNLAGSPVTLDASLRSGSDYGLSVTGRNIPEAVPIEGTSFSFWGDPSDPAHDADRACPGQLAPWEAGPTCASGSAPTAFLRYPTSCVPDSVGLTTSLHTDSWTHPGVFEDALVVSHEPPGYPVSAAGFGPRVGTSDCQRPPFDPQLIGQPTTPPAAGEPAGFAFDLKIPQSVDPSRVGEADLRTAVVSLPAGVRVSPSSAGGLGACSPAQIGLLGSDFAPPNPVHFSTADPSCPDSSRIGTLQLTTPLLAEPLTGSVFLATPHENPFDSLISLYLVAKGPGLIVKLPGRVDTDPVTGQLTATFDNNPQLPFSDLHLELKGGSRAPLTMPSQCGTYNIHAAFTSWNDKHVESDSPFTVSADGNGAPCPPSGFSPRFTAGTENPRAGADSPFVFQLTRSDQDQQISGLSLDMATGLTARIANAVLCPDSAANTGTCQNVSRIGSVTVGAGAGTTPFYITTGTAYLTGPYKDAPFGLAIVVPAIAGPFDLGNVIVRAAVYVNPTTAQVKVVSDPLPTILQGIPLDVRDIRVNSNKPRFFVNPTNCNEKHILAKATSTQNTTAHLTTRFQVGDCASLPFAPKLSMTIGAPHHTHAGTSTPLTATVTQPTGQANLRTVSVTLPSTLNALLPVVNRACTLQAFKTGHCTNTAKVGTAVATTPLLRDPLHGNVYFVKNGRPIPDLIIALHGQVTVNVDAHVTIPGGKRLGTTFISPDVPITRFTLRLVSGKNSPLGIVTNLCTTKAHNAKANITFRGQNGKTTHQTPTLKIAGCGKTR